MALSKIKYIGTSHTVGLTDYSGALIENDRKTRDIIREKVADFIRRIENNKV